MTVNFYNMKFKKNELNKVLNTPIVKTCSVKDGITLEDPVLYLEYNTALLAYDYVYIPDFQRYYFVTGREIDGKTLYISLHVDVLMSFKNDIMSSVGTATRSNFYNKNIPDKMVASLPGENIQYRTLSSAVNGWYYFTSRTYCRNENR